jgi:L-gulonolactone oxidase
MTPEPQDSPQLFENFGGNQKWYSRPYRPQTEDELLDILTRHSGETVKAIGSGHSWSDCAADADITLDMTAFATVEPVTVDGQQMVRVGAGCRLQDLLDRLHATTDQTLPTLGAIKRQTISGAVSTGTHGSGRQGLSHFVSRVRAATFDPATGVPAIREFADGPELLAARCGLGCMGIIVAVDLHTVPKYLVAETVRRAADLADVLRRFEQHPLTNFAWSPYSWTLMAIERTPVKLQPQSLSARLKARFFRVFNLLTFDILFHLLIIAGRWFGRPGLKLLFTLSPRMIVTDNTRVDDSEHVLTMNHHFFRHEEMEIFVRQPELAHAMDFLRAAIEAFSQVDSPARETLRAYLADAGIEDDVGAIAGSYVHHYPLFCRRVLPEDTMISMASSIDEPIYSISIFTYDAPTRREPYYAFCSVLARTLLKLVGARCHWGKHMPLEYADIAPLYPQLEEFRALCRRHDPNGVLRNGYTVRVLDLPVGGSKSDVEIARPA